MTAENMEERRRSPRYPVIGGEPVILPFSLSVQLLDISQTGISLLSDAAPNGFPPMWVCLKGAQPTEWVETSIRALALKEPGTYVIRLEFRDLCPYELFKTAVYGYFGS